MDRGPKDMLIDERSLAGRLGRVSQLPVDDGLEEPRISLTDSVVFKTIAIVA